MPQLTLGLYLIIAKIMSGSKVYHPSYIRVIEKKPGGWLFKALKSIATYKPGACNTEELKALYGMDERQVTIELFKINGGMLGFYIADLRNQKFYYCGFEPETVRPTLLKIGIGREEPSY